MISVTLIEQRKLFEEQILADNSYLDIPTDWDNLHEHYSSPRAHCLFRGWQLARSKMNITTQDCLDARRHRYMRSTTTSIRDGEDILDCTPEEYDAAIDLALARDPNFETGIKKEDINEVKCESSHFQALKAKAFHSAIKNLLRVANDAGYTYNTCMMDEAIKEVEDLLEDNPYPYQA